MDKQGDLKDNITDKDLDAIYLYIDTNFDSFTEEEMSFWKSLLEKIDPEFYDS